MRKLKKRVKQKGVIQKLKKSKGFMVLFIFGICFSLVSGAYFLGLTITGSYQITSDVRELIISVPLTGFTMNVSNSSELSKIDNFQITNYGGVVPMTFEFNDSAMVSSDLECDGEGDLEYYLTLEETPLTEGVAFDMQKLSNNFELEIVAVAGGYTCPRNGNSHLSVIMTQF